MGHEPPEPVSRVLLRIGSVKLWAQVDKRFKEPRLAVWMTSELADQPRQIGCTAMFDDIEEFVVNTKSLLKELEK